MTEREAIKLLKTILRTVCLGNQKFIDAVKKAISALKKQEQNRWIPVTERLPEKEGWYITTVESEKTGKRRIENDLFAIDIAVAHGHTPCKFCKDGHRQKTIAWCPFPEPYTEEES